MGVSRGGVMQVPVAVAATLIVGAGLALPLAGDVMPLVAVVIAILPLAAVFVLRIPFLLCLAFVVFSFFRIHEVFYVLNSLKLPKLIALATLTSIAGLLLTGKLKPFWRAEFGWLLVFFLHITIGMFLSVGRPIAIAYWMDTYSKIILLVFVIAYLVEDWRHFSIAGSVFIMAGSLVSMVAISNWLQGVGLVEGTRVTISREEGSVLGDPNDLSLVLLFPMAFSMAWASSRGVPRLERLLGLAGLGLIVWAILCTQSRGGLFGIVAAVAIIGMRAIKSKGVLLLIVGVLVVGLFAAAGISGRSSGGADEAGIDE